MGLLTLKVIGLIMSGALITLWLVLKGEPETEDKHEE